MFDVAICFNIPNSDSGKISVLAETKRILKTNGYLLIINKDTYKLSNLSNIGETVGYQELKLPLITRLGKNRLKGGFRKGDILLLRINKTTTEYARLPRALNIIHYSSKFDGISEYSKLLKKRLEKEYGLYVNMVRSATKCNSHNVIIEYTPGLITPGQFLKDIILLRKANINIYLDLHEPLFLKFSPSEIKQLERITTLMYRANELAEYDAVTNYKLFPLISYRNKNEINNHNRPKTTGKLNICLGTFGFASKWKRIDEIIRISKQFQVKVKVLMSIPSNISAADQKVASDFIDGIIKKNRTNKYLIIKSGNFTNAQLLSELSECTHFIFSIRNNIASSATMQFVKKFNKPIISLDTFQARQAQAIRCTFFLSRASVFLDYLYVFVLRMNEAMTKHSKFDIIDKFKEGLSILTPLERPLSRDFFKRQLEISKDEDGLDYLISIINYKNSQHPEPT